MFKTQDWWRIELENNRKRSESYEVDVTQNQTKSLYESNDVRTPERERLERSTLCKRNVTEFRLKKEQ